jgi:excinuclease ABC subunit A
MSSSIVVKGAREHNLKNIDVTIPRDKLVVITGLSGSGKSSLAFDTIYAEGQRRYVESLSSYARQFLGMMEKPDVDQIDGLSPAISIDQKSTSRNPRSTVATVTEIYDYLRLMFARIGVPHCPECGKSVTRTTSQHVIDQIASGDENAKFMLLAPIVAQKKGEFMHIPEQYMKLGFARARVDGIVYALDEFPELDKQKKHTIDIVVDRFTNSPENLSRLSQSVEQAFSVANDKVILHNSDTATDQMYSLQYACIDHPEIQIPELEPRTFSFNNPQGACPVCTGLGNRLEVDPELLLNKNLTIAEGAIRPWNRFAIDAWYMKKVGGVAEQNGFDLNTPVKNLTEVQMQALLYGTGGAKFDIELAKGRSYETTYEGIIPNLERRHKETESEFMRKDIEKFMIERPCHACRGKRLKDVVIAITVGDKSIIDVCEMNIDVAFDYIEHLKLEGSDAQIAEMILKEIKNRLGFLIDVGLTYLSLSRSATTLSGGEAQRIRLATQIGSGLMGVLYVLDEPSIGLHQRDNERLIKTLKHMRDLGNTVLVVEHDEDTIRTADYLIDIGPGAGIHGGQVIAAGTPAEVEQNPASITGQYLVGARKIEVPKKRRKGNGKALKIIGATENNLRNVTVSIPLGMMVVVSGVSGSGKSSLVNDILASELSSQLHHAHVVPGKHESLEGVEHLDKVIVIDQSPIGRTPRSNSATYTGLFTPIRDLFASLPEAKIRGYKTGRFSFNVKGGRCENCQGDGIIKIEMHFLPDVYVQCEICKGKRYNREALEIQYKGKSIADILAMTCEDALSFFENQPGIARKLQTIVDVGLGYIALGQSATTLSGGEAQRVKLATELSRRPTGRTLYVLDEPTTGLHIHDVSKLLEVLQALVDTGNSMIIIEHNLDVVKSADYVIDMGPEGGSGGGMVVAEGTPEKIAATKASYTGQFLKHML